MEMPGCYEVEASKEGYRIDFRAIKNVSPTIDDQLFTVEIVKDLNRFRRLVKLADSRWRTKSANKLRTTFEEVYRDFVSAAQGGVQHGVGSLVVGRPALENARQSALFEIGRVARNRFLGRMLGCSSLIFVISLLFLVRSAEITNMIRSHVVSLCAIIDVDQYVVSSGFSGIGLFIALNLANIWYLSSMTWEKVDFLDRDGMLVSVRVLSVFLTMVTLMILLSANVIIIGIMSIQLNSYRSNISLALIIGLLCGIGEVAINAIIRRTLTNQVVVVQSATASPPT